MTSKHNVLTALILSLAIGGSALAGVPATSGGERSAGAKPPVAKSKHRKRSHKRHRKPQIKAVQKTTGKSAVKKGMTDK